MQDGDITKNEEAVFEKLLQSGNSSNVLKDVENACKKLDSESFVSHILSFIRSLLEKKDKEAFQKRKKIEENWANEQLTCCCKIIFNCKKYNEVPSGKFLGDARKLVNALEEPKNDLEASFQKYAQVLCQWVENANQDIRDFNVEPFWINFTETIFEYSKEYQEEQARIAAKKKAEEEKRKAEEAKAAEAKKMAETARRKAQQEKELAEQKAREIEEDRLRKINFLKENGITIGSLKDDRDGKEYKTVTIGEQTWMAEPLCYSEKVGICSDGEGVSNHKLYNYFTYNWYAAKHKKSYKDTNNLGKAFAGCIAFIVILAILVAISIGLGALAHSCCFDSIAGNVLYWGLVIIPTIVVIKMEEETPAIVIIPMELILAVAAILNYINGEQWFWYAWLVGFGTYSIILASVIIYNSCDDICSSYDNFFDTNSIAPEGYRMPTKEDQAKLKAFFNIRFPNKKGDLTTTLKKILPKNLLIEKNSSTKMLSDIYWVEGVSRWTKDKFKPFIGIKK